MGTASSSLQSQEGEHFSQIINPPKLKPGDPKPKVVNGIKIHPKAVILKKISHDVLWEKFLASPAQSFALSFYEATAVLLEAGLANETLKKDKAGVETEIKGYIDLVGVLSEKDTSKCIDFMAVCSSVLLLSDMAIEAKVDRLFELIVLKENASEYSCSFDEFLVALSSFERGLSHAMGLPACSENYVRTVATQWMALADPKHKGSADVTTTISSKSFFDFCTNRQHVVRKLLEAFGNSITINTTRSELVEVVDTVNNLMGPPAGGDEWMANPAWKKTAERMVPPALKASAASLNVKPSSTLTLEWVHGYRGFDCRNNVYFLNTNTILYSAAAVGIALEYSNEESVAASKSQTHFSEHGDDIISVTVASKTDGSNVIASGEIGKCPAIYLYSYSKGSGGRGGAGGGSFQSLSCMKGFHTKGVAQLAFNNEGGKLFSIGVDYTVAIYSTNAGDKQFGKMIGSSQGPKDKILHCCYFGSPECDSQFISCGEKHVLVWKIDKGTLKQEQAKLTGGLKNKFFLCAVAVSGSTALLSTNEGELLSLSSLSVMPVIFSPELPAGALCGHGKNAINCMCVSADQRLLVTGGKDGKVIVWQIVSASATVTLRQVVSFDIYGHSTSAASPSIRVTGQDLSVGKGPAAAPPAIRSVALSADLKKIVVGTSTCEIVEYRLARAGVSLQSYTPSGNNGAPFDAVQRLVAGHSKDEVWGLAIRPVTPENAASGIEYCTVGDDGYARFWSLADHSQVRCMNLFGMARAVAYSPDAVYLAIGFGGRVGTKNTKNKEDGLVKVYRRDGVGADGVEQMTLCVELKDAKQWISVVKFSPDGSTLAVGSRDNSIYLYGVNQQFKKRAKFSKHNSGINQLDFTADSKYIQSTCSGYEILFSDAATGTQLTDGATKLLDAQMDSFTCTLGWPVIGIWSGAMDGSDVNSVDRSPSGKLLATSDDFGKVNVFRYPAIRDGGNVHAIYNGHSSHVTGVRWVSLPTKAGTRGNSDDYLISIGGEDKCVFQWRNSGSEESGGGGAKSLAVEDVDVEVDSEDAGLDGPVGGDEFTAVKPWLGAIVKPTAWVTKDASKIHPFYAALGEFSTQHKRIQDEIIPQVKKDQGHFSADTLDVYSDLIRAGDVCLQKLYDSGLENDTSPPDIDELELEWVHGYRGFDCRNNVYYVEPRNARASRLVVYYAAALGIVMDPEKRTQKYFKGHSDDIMSMAINKTAAGMEGDAIVATGQQGMGTTFVWEVPSMKTLASLSTKQKSVHMLAFSNDGRLIISIAEDKTIAVSDWKSGSVLVNTKGEAAVTHHLTVAPSTAGSSLNFITCGDKYIRYWTLNGRNLTAGKVGTTGKGKIQQYLSVAELGGSFFMGCEDGAIYVIPSDGKAVKDVFTQLEGGAAATTAAATAGGKGGKGEAKGPAVTAIYANNERNLLITGSKDGTIVVWDGGSLTPVFLKDRARKAQFNVDSLGVDIMAKQIQSVSLLNSASTGGAELHLVIGTRGCDIVEVTVSLATGQPVGTAKVLMRAHCNDELWGLATHPTRPEYCSTGDDKTLRFFNIHTRAMIASVPLGNISRTVCYNSDGTLLAVGFGGRVGKGKEGGGGVVRLYSVVTGADGRLTVTNVAEKQDAKQWISDVKFSADNNTLAVAAHDCKIYIYTVTKEGAAYSLKLRTTFGKHNAVLNHIDLSSDGRYMQSNCSAYELLFCDTTNGKQITAATELRDVKWHSWTCTLGWPVQGIWAKGMDGSDINAVHRSHSGHLLATSDDFGKVNLFKYPCIAEGAQPLKYSGHSSHVMNVRFTVGDECLISCGGNDKCLMQWRHTIADVSSGSGGGGSSGHDIGGSSKKHVAFDDAMSEHGSEEAGGEADFGGLGEPQGGDECGAIKPWLGAIRAPKNPPLISSAAPAAELALTWVHGYTSGTAGANNSRISNNLFYNLEMNPVYPAAALGIQLSRSSGNGKNGGFSQTYFQGHDDDILSLAISKDRRYIATGQTASKSSKGKGSIIVWDAIQSRILTRMDGCHARGVVSLAFNPEGNMLLSVGLDDNNTHILWSDMGGGWSRVQQVACEKSDKNPVLFSRWVHPSNPMCSSAEYHFLTGGGSGVNFWKLAGSQLSKKQGRFGRKYKQCPLLCSANLHGKEGWSMIVGTSTGDLYSYSEREVNNSVEKAHAGPVICLAEGGADCLFLVSGGKDHQVRVWNSQLQPMSNLDCTGYSFVDATIASIDIRPVLDGGSSGSGSSSNKESANDLVLLVGTHGGEILEITAKSEGGGGGGAGKSGSKKASAASAAAASASSESHEETRNLDLSSAEVEVLVYSHCSGELWGVATHPLNPDIIATVGDDSTLRIWSLKSHKMLKCVKLGWPARCVAWHPLGSVLAVGFMESVKGGYKSGGGGGKGKKAGGKAKKAGAAAPAGPVVKKNSEQPTESPEDTGTEGGESDKDAGHKGAVHIYSFKYTASNSTAEVVKRVEGCESIAWMADIKFSPKGDVLCASSHDRKLYAYNIPPLTSGDVNEIKWSAPEWRDCLSAARQRFAFDKHSSAIVHFDFTFDGKYFQTNCQAGELLFGLLDTGAHEKSATKVADYNGQLEDTPESEGRLWATQTCILGWSVQGIWPNANNIQLSDINAVDRHTSSKFLATADDYGLVKLFRFPCVNDSSKFNSYTGHSSHVTNCRWTIGNNLITTGGNDKCVFVWDLIEK